jgi:hypothetical protein
MARQLPLAALLLFGVMNMSNAQDLYVVGQTDLAQRYVSITIPRTGKSIQGYAFNDEQGPVIVEQNDLDRVEKCINDARQIRDQAVLQQFCIETAISYYGKDSRVTRWFFRSSYYGAINNTR